MSELNGNPYFRKKLLWLKLLQKMPICNFSIVNLKKKFPGINIRIYIYLMLVIDVLKTFSLSVMQNIHEKFEIYFKIHQY